MSPTWRHYAALTAIAATGITAVAAAVLFVQDDPGTAIGFAVGGWLALALTALGRLAASLDQLHQSAKHRTTDH